MIMFLAARNRRLLKSSVGHTSVAKPSETSRRQGSAAELFGVQPATVWYSEAPYGVANDQVLSVSCTPTLHVGVGIYSITEWGGGA